MKVQIKIDPEVWRDSRMAALRMDKNMGEFVELALKDLLHVVSESPKPSPAATKQPSKASESVAPDKMVVQPSEEVSDIYSIERKNCGQCGESFPVNLLQVVRVPGSTKSKPLCKSCIDNFKNGQA